MSNFYDVLEKRIDSSKNALAKQKARKARAERFKYKPFSKKQKQILNWWTDNSPVKDKDGIIADGSIRAGKTLAMSLSYGLWSMTRFNGQKFLICGKTILSLRRNVIIDWMRLMKMEGYSVFYRRADNIVTVSKGEVTNEYYLFGGKDESSQDLVQGITAAGVLFDEVALMPESFVNQATGRCSVEGSKFWFNCNPEGPFHWFKTNWINKILGIDPLEVFDEDNPAKNLVYLHFTQEDNLSLSEAIKARYRAMYAGVFYKRFIEGLWVVASGIVYDVFDKAKHTYSKAISMPSRKYISVDYGTTNPTVFLGISDDDPIVRIEKEYYYDSKKEGRQKSDSEYGDDFDKFVEEWGQKPRLVIIDPSAASFKVELKKRGYHTKDADNAVLDGIRQLYSLLALGYIAVHDSCVNIIAEFYSYSWDEKAAESGKEKPIEKFDHAMDALRYFIKTILKKRRFSAK